MTRILMLCHDTQERVSAGQVPCGGSGRPLAHRYGIDTETEFWGPFWGPREDGMSRCVGAQPGD